MWTGSLPILPPAAGKPEPTDQSRPNVVALGGGHGLYASLSALRHVTGELTAVVTVADDGGSSGRLRTEMGVLPPGDLRMALAALCDTNDWGRTWRDVMQHRFVSQDGIDGSLDGHTLGNLLIVTLWELLGDPVAGLQWAGALLGARGTVLPMSKLPLTIEGDVLQEVNGQLSTAKIVGQSHLARAGAHNVVSNVRLFPEDAPACEEALNAIEFADWVVLGPGSWYTSVLPHLLLPEMRRGLQNSTAKRALVMNLSTETEETVGMSPSDFLRVIKRYAPELRFDVVVADPTVLHPGDGFEEAARELGAQVSVSKLGVSSGEPIHDPIKLAAAMNEIFEG
ncbi:gluconeogenesis factor YvcK family protein [Haematomicrobium sanguinis]|uniref:gluconeogenesis factor YvcK family protein n=1 Tax=Haematomicrobium sanguinis TaxID=479106 RepID=UPI00047AA961|nr:uridine diphosphate-N-acetylglucosamine-binding protein YvcK [Haematomicrobium sanguinis]